jgi:hypothetical protein
MAIDAGSFFNWGYLNNWSLLHFEALEASAMGVSQASRVYGASQGLWAIWE